MTESRPGSTHTHGPKDAWTSCRSPSSLTPLRRGVCPGCRTCIATSAVPHNQRTPVRRRAERNTHVVVLILVGVAVVPRLLCGIDPNCDALATALGCEKLISARCQLIG